MNAEKDGQERENLTVAEYALGVLPHDEREAFAERLANEPALREKLRRWEAHFVPMADEYEPAAPPPGVFAEIEKQLFGPAPGRTGLFARLGFWRAVSFVCLAGMLVFAGLFYNSRINGGPSLVAELRGESDIVRLVALYDEDQGILRLNRTQGAPVPGRAFELWLIEESGVPVSLGVLPHETYAGVEISAELGVRLRDSVLAISDEPEGGSPTGQPTGDVLATGEVTRI